LAPTPRSLSDVCFQPAAGTGIGVDTSWRNGKEFA
jgi:hypothetical protein